MGIIPTEDKKFILLFFLSLLVTPFSKSEKYASYPGSVFLSFIPALCVRILPPPPSPTCRISPPAWAPAPRAVLQPQVQALTFFPGHPSPSPPPPRCMEASSSFSSGSSAPPRHCGFPTTPPAPCSAASSGFKPELFREGRRGEVHNRRRQRKGSRGCISATVLSISRRSPSVRLSPSFSAR